MWWLLVVLAACGGPKKAGVPTSASSSAESISCVMRDYLAEEAADSPEAYAVSALFFGQQDFEATSCNTRDLLVAGIELPLGSELPLATFDLRSRRTIDSHEFYLRIVPATSDFDADMAIEQFVAQALSADDGALGRVEAGSYDPAIAWPVHPDSPNRDRTEMPDWWGISPGAPGRLTTVQQPAVLSDCMSPRASGALGFANDAAVYLHGWSFQHFSPSGGCGG